MPVAILIPALQLLQPMPGVITQGVRPGHPAIDIACVPGTPVRAAHDGQGSQERSLTHGITFVLNGSGGLRTSYSHLEKASASGSFRRGDVIGSCGNTGIWSSGPHLHFEIRAGARAVDPAPFFTGNACPPPPARDAEVLEARASDLIRPDPIRPDPRRPATR